MKAKSAFTLIEMLCVLAILGIFVVVLGNSLSNSLVWFQSAFEQEVIEENFMHILDFIEKDVRGARDVNQAATEVKDNAQNHVTNFLYLECANPQAPSETRQIAYSVKSATDTDYKNPARERPQVRCNIYRAVIDRSHQGYREPVGNYVLDKRSFRVSYFDIYGNACVVGGDVYAVQVELIGKTKQGHRVTKKRCIPLSSKAA